MRVVLPREPDAAERLHAVLGVGERGVERERGRGRDREGGRPGVGVGEVVGRGGRVPHRGPGELDAGEHLRAAVLHTLELADRPAELHAHLGVLGRGVDAPLRDADGFGREQRRREQPHGLVGEVRELALGGGGRGGGGRGAVDAGEAAR